MRVLCSVLALCLGFGLTGCDGIDASGADELASEQGATNARGAYQVVEPSTDRALDEASGRVGDEASPGGDGALRSEGLDDPTPSEPSVPSVDEPPADVVPVDTPAVDDASAAPGQCPDFQAMGALDSCCDGTGSCIPMNALPPGLQSQVSTCADGSACVPKSIIESIENEGGFWPLACVSVGGADGVCLSTCIPKVGQFAALLPQDVCEASERCAPCIDPLTGVDSGACGDGLQCAPEESEANEEGGASTQVDEAVDEPQATEPEPEPQGYSCENLPTEPIADPELFEPCGVAAHCVPEAAVEEELQADLAVCDGGFCVPDMMIASGGWFIPQTCTSLNGAEGRCLHTALPAVNAMAGVLPVDVCEDYERCSPCCDPLTGLASGACEQSCDSGALDSCSGESEYVSCCGGEGHCIEGELLPDGIQGSLAKCKGEAKGSYCVPDAMHSPDYEGEPCQGNSLILGQYAGVCLPKCLKIFLEISFDNSACQPGHMCVPCEDPILGGTTDAPGCQP